MAKRYCVYGWDDNYVLIPRGNGKIDIYDALREEDFAGGDGEYPSVGSVKEALELIEQHNKWDGGGDVNVEGMYFDFGGHDYGYRRADEEPNMFADDWLVSQRNGASAKKSQDVRKNVPDNPLGWGERCPSYLGVPVCPECGSPNLIVGKEFSGVSRCICSRCMTACYFDDNKYYDTKTGADNLRYTSDEIADMVLGKAKTKATSEQFSDMVKMQRAKNHEKK